MRSEALVAFAAERERIRVRRESGQPPPWTSDPILGRYRFCNVRREDDAVTRWLREEWREPHQDDPDLWFAMVVARHFNLPSFLGSLDGPPLPWRSEVVLDAAVARRRVGARIFSSAYMISTCGREAPDKVAYLCDYVFSPMWRQREQLRPRRGDTLCAYHVLLGQLYGLAGFLAAQVMADLKYAEPLSEAPDWSTFASSGPGSRQGMNYLLGRGPREHWREDDWRLALARLAEVVAGPLADAGVGVLHAQDLQNVLCEFAKYERARMGHGRPKQLLRSATLGGAE